MQLQEKHFSGCQPLLVQLSVTFGLAVLRFLLARLVISFLF